NDETLKAVRLDRDSGFSQFLEVLLKHPHHRQPWNSKVADVVSARIEEWARANAVKEGVWWARPADAERLQSTRLVRRDSSDGRSGLRERVYAALDRIPAERLMLIRIPLAWLVDARDDPQHE